jgi:hypothetical protein
MHPFDSSASFTNLIYKQKNKTKKSKKKFWGFFSTSPVLSVAFSRHPHVQRVPNFDLFLLPGVGPEVKK